MVDGGGGSSEGTGTTAAAVVRKAHGARTEGAAMRICLAHSAHASAHVRQSRSEQSASRAIASHCALVPQLSRAQFRRTFRCTYGGRGGTGRYSGLHCGRARPDEGSAAPCPYLLAPTPRLQALTPVRKSVRGFPDIWQPRRRGGGPRPAVLMD